MCVCLCRWCDGMSSSVYSLLVSIYTIEMSLHTGQHSIRECISSTNTYTPAPTACHNPFAKKNRMSHLVFWWYTVFCQIFWIFFFWAQQKKGSQKKEKEKGKKSIQTRNELNDPFPTQFFSLFFFVCNA